MKNRTNVKLTQKQFAVISHLGEGWTIKQYGKRTAHLIRSDDGVENYCQVNVTSVGIPTVNVLLKKKLIELDQRITWDKRYRLSQKGEQALLSLAN